MLGTDGLTATSGICSRPELAATRVLILTTFENDQNVAKALRAGASGFLGKDVGPDVLPTGIRTRGGRRVPCSLPHGDPGPLITRFLSTPDNDTPLAPPERLATLTEREREVMSMAAHGRFNTEIADHLVVSPLTVRSHIQRAATKPTPATAPSSSSSPTRAAWCGHAHRTTPDRRRAQRPGISRLGPQPLDLLRRTTGSRPGIALHRRQRGGEHHLGSGFQSGGSRRPDRWIADLPDLVDPEAKTSSPGAVQSKSPSGPDEVVRPPHTAEPSRLAGSAGPSRASPRQSRGRASAEV